MGLFGNSARTTPPLGTAPAIGEFNRGGFDRTITTRAPDLMNKLSGEMAPAMCNMLFDQAVKMCRDGFFSSGHSAHAGGVVQANSVIRFKDAAAKRNFDVWIGAMLDSDARNIERRERYLDGLLDDAIAGDLRRRLDGNTMPRETYCPAPPSPAESMDETRRRGPNPVFPLEAEHKKLAVAWTTRGVRGSNLNDYARQLEAHVTRNGTNPVGGDMSILTNLSDTLVKDKPKVRLPGLMGQPYPSSVGGTYLMRRVFDQLTAHGRFPPLGDPKWENWALFMHAAITAAQPFPDGNKRVARMAYGLIIVSAHLRQFRVPSIALENELGQM